jgi:RNA polymerase sigma-70 factor (ECF subfamily)
VTETEQKEIFEDWLKRHKGLMFKIVRAYAFEPMAQDDLFQEIIIQVWRSVLTFRNESAVTTWIYRIALNTAIKWVNRERKHSTEPVEKFQHLLEENRVEQDERLSWLYDEIHKLDEVDRSIALLMLDGFSYKDMAAMLGITESHVGVKISRIKKQLVIRSKQFEHGI